MLSPTTLSAYRARRTRNIPAHRALAAARDPQSSANALVAASAGAPHNLHGFKACRWIDNPEGLGLRLVNHADKIAPRAIRHHGWFLNEFQDETARGVVYQTSARRGQARFLAGLVTPHDGTSGALIETGDTYDNERDAALAADQFAERYAEAEREYQDAWQAGSRWADLPDDDDERETILDCVRRDTFDAFADGANLSPAQLSALTGIRP